MKSISSKQTSPKSDNPLRLQNILDDIAHTCINCKFCKRECAFLHRYGKPKEIARNFSLNDPFWKDMPFECSLCQLCGSVCPVDLDPASMFLEMRREVFLKNHMHHHKHSKILAYERRGTSRRYSYYTLPKNCDTVFFPGCAVPGAQPDATLQLFEQLRETIPNLGMVLDCCTKPSHDLGRQQYFEAMFGEMKDYLSRNQVHKVLVACPSCFRTFRDYGTPLQVETVYEVIARNGLPGREKVQGVVCVHDPCATRYESDIHEAVRQLIRDQGLIIEPMQHERDKTFCCGEGGAVGFVAPDYARQWALARNKETNGRRIITYCAGCVNYLGTLTHTSHLLDLLFQPTATMDGKVKCSRAPFTYLNRIRLKSQLRRTVTAGVTRERTYLAEKRRSPWF